MRGWEEDRRMGAKKNSHSDEWLFELTSSGKVVDLNNPG